MDKISKIGLTVSAVLLIGIYAFNLQQSKKPKSSPPAAATTPIPVKEAVMDKNEVPGKTPAPGRVEVVSSPVREEPIRDTVRSLPFPDGLETVRVDTPLMSVELNPFGGVITSVILKENEKNGIRKLQGEKSAEVTLFQVSEFGRAAGAILSAQLPPAAMAVERKGDLVAFSHRYDNGVSIEKIYSFNEHSYMADVVVTVSNGSPSSLDFQDERTLDVVCASLSPIEKRDDILGVDISTEMGSVIRKTGPAENTPEKVSWMGLKTKYFACIMKTDLAGSSFEITGLAKAAAPSTSRAVLGCAGGPAPTQYQYLTGIIGLRGNIKPGETATYKFTYYLGPADYSLLKGAGNGFDKVLNLGMFGPVSIAMIWLLDQIYAVIGSYGWSIIIMTMIAKLVVWPLTHKSYKSMREMNKLQPLIRELKEKCKNDAKKLQAETMKLYKEHGVSPWGGCLPMLLQMPILFALFNTLRNTILLRKAPFWLIPGKWIMDLSGPDALITFEQPMRLLIFQINQFNLLPVLMGASFFLQQKMTPPPASGNPQSDQQQKMMSIMMPVMFLFIFYTLPAGLNLYFFVSTITSVLGQKFAARVSKK